MRTPIHRSTQFKVTFMALLLAALLFAGSGMPDRAIAAETYAGSYTGCANPGDQTDIPEAECDALVAIYNSTAGASWNFNTGWLVDNTPCSWRGVTCSSVPGNVTELDSANNNLTGSIPAEIGNLASLEYLDMYNNNLAGSIPAEIGSLTSLQSILLNNNTLTGSIPPELGNLTSLYELELNVNQLIGSIPSELGSLTALDHLNLNTNQLSGPLPQTFTNLTGLLTFYYHNTNLCAPDNVAFQNWLTGVPTKNGTTLYCEVVFSDGFESGDTSAWSSTVESPAQLGGLFSDQYIPPGLGLIVHPKAAYLGGYGLGAIVEDKHPMFVQDDSPAAETSYRARFYLLVKSLTANPYKGMGLLLGSGTGKSFQVFAGWDGAQHVIVARVGEDHGAWTWTSYYVIPTNDWVLVEIDWTIATGDGNNDGFFSLYLDGVLKEVVPSLDNDAVSVDSVKLGPFYVSPGVTGIIGFDAFSSESVYSP